MPRARQNAPNGMQSMKLSAITMLVCSIALGLGLAWPEPSAMGRVRAPTEVPECVTVRNASRRAGYGYDHVVYVRNDCSVTVECTVGTHRNPKPEFGLVVAPGEENGVVTGTHAKKRRFKSWVTCTRRPKTSVSAELDRAKGMRTWVL